jgi:hypothetical protein
MLWDIVESNLDALQDEVELDQELYSLATTVGIDSAGELLDERADPDAREIATPPYWSYLKREIFELLCTERKKYHELRARIATAERTTKTWFLPMLAGVIGSEIGVAAAILMPFVSLSLLGAANLGVQAWCKQAKYEFGTPEEPLLLQAPKTGPDSAKKEEAGAD